MDNSIVGGLSFHCENDAKQTIEYLNKIGLGSDRSRKINTDYMWFTDTYIIEFKQKPFIFKILEYNNLLAEGHYADIQYISEHGISFYIVGVKFGDGNIFIPMNNINCIHTIEKQQLDRQISSGRRGL